ARYKRESRTSPSEEPGCRKNTSKCRKRPVDSISPPGSRCTELRTRVRCARHDKFKGKSMSTRSEIDRRTFMKLGSSALAVGISPALATSAKTAVDSTPYPVKWYPFTQHPDSDTCWSLSVGPDGRIYAAACAESVPGGVVKPVRYNEQRDDLD